MISGRASRDYACGIKEGDVIPTVNTLSNIFGYFKAMRTCHSKLRYFDWDGQVHLAKGKTGGQQGDPLEMLIFNLTIHHLWGRVLAKFQEARAVAYADDGYIKAKLSVALQFWLSSRPSSRQMLVWSSTSLRPLYYPRVSLPRLRLIWRRPSCKQPQAWLTLVTIFSSIPSALKVSLALVCLLALMLLYRVLWLKHVGKS